MRITEGQLRKIIREELNEASARKPWYEALFDDIRRQTAGHMRPFDPRAWLAANTGVELTLNSRRKRGEIPAEVGNVQWLQDEYTKWLKRRDALARAYSKMQGAIATGDVDPYYIGPIMMWLSSRTDIIKELRRAGVVEHGEDLEAIAGELKSEYDRQQRLQRLLGH